MISKTITGGRDTWLPKNNPTSRHGGDDFLRLDGSTDSTAYAYWNPGWRPPAGTLVLSATARWFARNASSGNRTLSLRRIVKSWKAGSATWKDGRPDVIGVGSTVNVGALKDGDPIDLDVTKPLQRVADGAPFYGFRLETNSTARHMVYGVDAGRRVPRLIVSYAFKPKAPTGLTTGGQVSKAKPFLHFAYNAMRGKVKLSAIQVRIDPAQSTSAPAWDSGEWATVEPELDLEDTTYPGLADGGTTFWQLRYKTADGLWSPWSSWVSLTRTAKGVLTIDAPGVAPNDFVAEATPPILWTFANQASYQVTITPAGNRSKILHDSGHKPGAAQSYTPPNGVITKPGMRYSVRLRVWDAKQRIATGGDPTFVALWRDFTFAYDATPDPVSNLKVTQPAGFPRAKLTFDRATPPDSFSIERNGDIIATGLDPSALLTSGTSYAYEDWTARPWKPNTYRVVPVVNGKATSRGSAVTVKLRAPGVWVGDPRTGWYFNVVGRDPGGPDVSGLEWGEDAEVTPKFAESVRKIGSMRGLEGPVSNGVLAQTDFDDRTLDAQLEHVWAIKGMAARIYRVVVADLNIPATVGNINPAPSSEYLDGIEQRAMSFSLWQKGELPFRPVAGN